MNPPTSYHYFIVLLLLFLAVPLTAQQPLFVKDIVISGNKKTKTATILRELTIQVGDTVAVEALSTTLETNRLQLLGTGLFVFAQMNVSEWDTDRAAITVAIEVQENWFIYPVPIFELADRNFNVWWVEQNAPLSRVNYGLWTYHINLTGRRDRLKLVTQFGFTRKFELDYYLPAFDNNQDLGFTAAVLFAENKNLAYRTFEDRLEFEKYNEEVLFRRLRFTGGLNFRKGVFQYHDFYLQFHRNTLNDYVPESLNPRFFLDGESLQRFFTASYHFVFDNRNFRPYPSAGQRLQLILEKNGFGIFDDINALYFTAGYEKYLPFGKAFNIEAIAKGRVALIRDDQPYYQSRALGYLNDFIRGYEYYVMDGLDYAYVKTALRYRIFERNINWKKAMIIPQLRIMPFKAYLSVHNDLGIANNPQFKTNNPLSNTLLWGGGIGLDLLFYNDKIIQLQYSINHLGENGLFLHYYLNF